MYGQRELPEQYPSRKLSVVGFVVQLLHLSYFFVALGQIGVNLFDPPMQSLGIV